MAPRRSGRRNVSAYKKGDYIEYIYKGSTVTGKLFKKSPNGTEASPIWIVTPSDRRRRNEDVPEKALGKIISAAEAMANRGPKLKAKGDSSPTASGTSHSDGSVADEAQDPNPSSAKRPFEDNGSGSGGGSKKRSKGDKKAVTFLSQESNATTTTSAAASSKRRVAKPTAKKAGGRIGTRSSRGPGAAMVLLPDVPIRRGKNAKGKKIAKDENVKIVKMLTGTLYLYRGDRPRAEFVRSK